MLYNKAISNIKTYIMAGAIIFKTNVAEANDKEFHGCEDKT